MELEIVKRLLSELVQTSNILVVIDSGGAVSEMYARGTVKPQFEGQWVTVESQDWHVHLNLKSVDGVQFVEAEDHGHDVPKLYYVRFSDAQGSTLIRFYFPNPWLDEEEKPVEFQVEKLRFFEEFRDRYVGKGGIIFVQRPQQVATST